ncbi:phage tail tape measure protein [Gluconobacter oxydans]|uniref:phage tail tape measure protein n=1 Tax=Gluconobacter oxydans TaxID=442 RepID=UPI0034646355
MSGSLTAQFELTLVDQMSGPVEKIEQILGRLNSTLDKMAHNPAFDEVWEPVPRCVEQTTVLSETLEEAASAATVLGEGLEVAATAATEAGSAMEMAAEGAGALDAALARTGSGSGAAVTGLNAVTEAADRTAAAIERASRTPGMGAPRFPGDVPPGESEDRPGYGRRVWGATQHFHEATERSIGQAFGAAAAGFGLVEPVKAAAEYNNDLTHIGIGLHLYGAANTAFVEQFGQKMDELARKTGQTGEGLVSAAAFFGREGYTGQRLDAVLPEVARISTAYTSNPLDVSRAAFQLHESMKIPDSGLDRALATMAVSGKLADMPMEELAPLFPNLVSQAAGFGVSGQTGLTNLLSGLAVNRKNSGSLGHAIENLGQLLVLPQSSAGVKNFAKLGVDINKLKADTLAHGGDTLEMLLETIDRVTKHTTDPVAMQTLFHNVQDRAGIISILQHWQGDPAKGDLGYVDVQKKLRGATPHDVDEDYATGLQSLKIKTQSFDESWQQLERRIGHGFAPILHDVTVGFHGMTEAMEGADKHMPGLTTGLLGTVGAALAATAGLGALGAVAGPVKAGAGIVTAALEGIGIAGLAATFEVAVLVAGVAAAGYAIYHNWDHIKAMFVSFEHWVSGWGDRVSGMVSGAFTHMFPHFPGSTSMSGPLMVPTTGPGWSPGGNHGPLKVDITHAPGLNVTTSPHPAIHATVLPSGGRMTNRP